MTQVTTFTEEHLMRELIIQIGCIRCHEQYKLLFQADYLLGLL